jgi:arylsulfatase A-like enzyme
MNIARKNRNSKLKSFIFCLIIISGLLIGSCNSYNTDKPNVLVIVVDDLGWGDIGYNNSDVYTPNLDKLANEGLVFTNHYSMPQCTPTRVALFTGRYPGRFGPSGLQATNDPVFPLGTHTMATLLRNHGYQTFLCGKWHMGSGKKYGPNHFGFDQSYGSFAGAVGMYDHRYRQGKFEYAWHRNHDTIPGHENGKHVTDLVADEAISIIKGERENPFFLYLAFHAPHTPLDERGKFIDIPTQLNPNDSSQWLNESEIKWFNDPQGKIQQEDDPEKRLFMAVVNHLDDAIGKVISALDDSDQLENTLILFTSDNGPQVNWGGNAYPDDLRLTNFNQPIPMRGAKLDVWEGGIHVPGFAYWKGRIKPGSVESKVHVIDWVPTLGDVLEIEVSNKDSWDGVSLKKMIFEKEELENRDLYCIWNRNTNRWALSYGDWKIVKYGTDEPINSSDWQLFNLVVDPMEENNVSEENQKTLKKLHNLYLKQREKDKKSAELEDEKFQYIENH